jgi:hypothetical protein
VILNQGALLATTYGPRDELWDHGRGSPAAIPKMEVVAGLILTDNDRASNLLTIGEPQTRQKPR